MKQVIKKINNNVVLAKDTSGQEYVLVGKGLGFQAVPYTLYDDSLIEHEYINARNNKMYELFKEFPTETVLLAEKIINVGKAFMKKDFGSSLLYSLSDHINYAIERVNKGIVLDSNLAMDLKHAYPDEVIIGKIAIQMIEDEMNIELPKAEANNIALHFINAEHDFNGKSDASQLAKTVDDITKIVTKYSPKPLNEDSIYYGRFVTHIRYFVLRQKEGVVFPERSNAELEGLIKEDQTLRDCVDEIERYIQTNYGWICSKEEEIYLMIHLKYLFYFQI